MNARERSAPGREITGAANHRLVQSYQFCPHSATRIERMAEGHPHYACEVCAGCGRHLRWIPKPQTILRRRWNAFALARLARCECLTPWEAGFVRSISRLARLSPRQQAVLERLVMHYLGRQTT
jgi:hypothetical protein